MRILVVGGTGTIGSPIADALSVDHQVIRAGHSTGDARVDLADPSSIQALYRDVGPLDAVVSAAGVARFKPLEELTDEDYDFSIRNKLMGQVNLVRLGLEAVRPGGSFTLTSGTLSMKPTPTGAAASLTGGALESWVRAAALELQGRYRVNAVSPGWVRETMVKLGMDPSPGVPAAELARTYVKAVTGRMTGQTFVVEKDA